MDAIDKFDNDKLDPTFPTGMEEMIISGMLEHPELLESHLPHLKVHNFAMAEAQLIVHEYLSLYQKEGAAPTREILWREISKKLFTIDNTGADSVKDLVFRDCIGREWWYVKETLQCWMQTKTLEQLYSDEGQQAILAGDYSYHQGILDEARAITFDSASSMITPSELFADLDDDDEWLIDGILAPGQPCIIGGGIKTMKTSIICDLVLSLAAGKPFLNIHPARQSRVLFISGESGRMAINETMTSIRRKRNITIGSVDDWFRVSFNLPLLARADGIAELRSMLNDYNPAVVILDPLYLCLLDAETAGNASNIFAMGSQLGKVSRLCTELGATPILCHHFKKITGSWPTLADLTQAGCDAFARQWMLFKRETPYNHDGIHELNTVIGGYGRSANFKLTIDEGIEGNRNWEVTTSPRASSKVDKVIDNKANKSTEEKNELARAIKILTSTKEPTNRNKLRQFLGWSGTRINRIIERELELHFITEQDHGKTKVYKLL